MKRLHLTCSSPRSAAFGISPFREMESRHRHARSSRKPSGLRHPPGLRSQLSSARLVLLTNAAHLGSASLREGLALLDRNHGEIWAKLDAGTEEYFRRVNRPNVPLTTVVDNILQAARILPCGHSIALVESAGQSASSTGNRSLLRAPERDIGKRRTYCRHCRSTPSPVIRLNPMPCL